jgi:hypothetical protein
LIGLSEARFPQTSLPQTNPSNLSAYLFLVLTHLTSFNVNRATVRASDLALYFPMQGFRRATINIGRDAGTCASTLPVANAFCKQRERRGGVIHLYRIGLRWGPNISSTPDLKSSPSRCLLIVTSISFAPLPNTWILTLSLAFRPIFLPSVDCSPFRLNHEYITFVL